jgi:hypothetical protein
LDVTYWHWVDYLLGACLNKLLGGESDLAGHELDSFNRIRTIVREVLVIVVLDLLLLLLLVHYGVLVLHAATNLIRLPLLWIPLGLLRIDREAV